jgi:cystathionine beta-lyase/cystathionine gamma-synthase
VQGGIAAGPRRLIDPIRRRMLHLGTTMSPFAAWLMLSGVHTLPLRMARHSENALRLATALHEHPAVMSVNYPGLISDPGHALATELLGPGADGCGGMVSFSLREGCDAFGRFLDRLQLSTIAVSLGDSSTLVWPWPGENLIRVSTGLEDSEDLIRDMTRALDALAAVAAD